MANTSTIQKILDGASNVVYKLSGIVDTSDVAATGTIGASGFTTTIGSKIVTFVAGALTPTVGQYLTFGDGTTTFPALTYITSITDSTHVVVSNAAEANNAAAAITITGTAGVVVLIDPAELASMGELVGQPTRIAIDKITFSVEAALAVNLYWEATVNQLILSLIDSGTEIEARRYGGLHNTEAAGATGKIVYTTVGWSGGAVLSYDVIIEGRKNV